MWVFIVYRCWCYDRWCETLGSSDIHLWTGKVFDALEHEYLNVCNAFLREFASIRIQGPVTVPVYRRCIRIHWIWRRGRGLLNCQQKWSLKSIFFDARLPLSDNISGEVMGNFFNSNRRDYNLHSMHFFISSFVICFNWILREQATLSLVKTLHCLDENSESL